MNREKAQQTLRTFTSLCNSFNNDTLLEMRGNKVQCQALLSMAYEAFQLFEFLHEKEPSEATVAYRVFSARIIARLHALNDGREREDQGELLATMNLLGLSGVES
jgi:hypothetical protein